MTDDMTEFDDLPENVQGFIKAVVKKVRYRKRVRADVFEELVTHFVDELADIADAAERERVGKKIIVEFGQPEILGKLIRRGKKRCRPLWKKVLIAGFKIGCVLVLLIGLRIGTFYIGKPVIKVDYAKWLIEKDSAGKDPKLNAKVDIDRAIELLECGSGEIYPEIIGMWPGDMNEVELQLAQKYLSDNVDVIKALRDAANKPYFWGDYDNLQFGQVLLSEAIGVIFQKELEDSDDLLDTLSNWRKLAYTMRLNVRFELYNEEIDQAIKDCFVIQKFGVFFEGQGLFIEQLVGIAIESLSRETVFDILSRAEITEAQLLSIENHYKKIVEKNKSIIDLAAEKALLLDQIQKGFTDDGKGDGRVLLNGLVFVVEDVRSFIKGFLLMDYPRKKEIINEVEQLYEHGNRLIELRPLQQLKQRLKITSSSYILKFDAGLFEKVHRVNWRVQTERLATATVIVIKRYQKEKRQLPISLQQLVDSGYMDEVPMDPFSDGALGYKVTEDDFILYSVGRDFEDDGGQVEYSKSGKVKQYNVEGGDYIFWPVRQKAE